MASGSFHVSIVAGAPTTTAPDDPAMAASVAALAKVEHPPLIARAAHMEGVWQRVADAMKSPARAGRKLALQLIGHGTSGVLHLGSSWMGETLPPETYADPFFLLDTNPWSLGFLAEFRGQVDRVILNACRVGASDTEGYTINGRTLAYTLCELLQTTVIAATDFTEPDELDAYGEYRPHPHHLQPCRWEWQPHAAPRYVDPNTTKPSLRRISGARPVELRVRAVRPRVPARARVGEIAADVVLRCAELAEPHLAHAAAELALRVDGADGGHAHMLGNGRVVRVGARLFAVENHDEVARQLGSQLAALA